MYYVIRFTPSLSHVIYHGDKTERDEIRRKYMPRTVGPKFPIVITSYDVALNDAKKHLRFYQWKYVVVDEVRDSPFSECNLSPLVPCY